MALQATGDKMEIDVGTALQDVMSDNATKRKRAEELILSKEQEDLLSWIQSLATFVMAPHPEPMAKLVASLVMKQALNRRSLAAPTGTSQNDGLSGAGGGCLWRSARTQQEADPAEALGRLLLEAWASVVQDSRLRTVLSCCVARAAAIQFVNGQVWPDLSQCLVLWSSGSTDKKIAVLQLLELLQEEVELQEQHPNFTSARASFISILAYLEDDRGGHAHQGLCGLLNTALEDELGQESRVTASRLFILLTTCEAVPALLREAARDLVSPVLAQVCRKRRVDEDDALSCCVPCLQAVVLAAHANPTRWAGLGRGSNGLAIALLEEFSDSCLLPKSRAAALVALLEILQCYKRASEDDVNAMDGDDEEDNEIVPRLVNSFRQVFLSLPEDDDTEEWAEGTDEEETSKPGTMDDDADDEIENEGRNELFEEVLDACERLCSERGIFYREMEALAQELLAGEAWRSKHGGLLLQLRLASGMGLSMGNPGPGAGNSRGNGATSEVGGAVGGVFGGQSAFDNMDDDDSGADAGFGIATRTFQEAAKCLLHVHPRVRWAGLEVWARLLVANVKPHSELVDETIDVLVEVAGSDPYLRVRSRALLVLLTMAQIDANSSTNNNSNSNNNNSNNNNNNGGGGSSTTNSGVSSHETADAAQLRAKVEALQESILPGPAALPQRTPESLRQRVGGGGLEVDKD